MTLRIATRGSDLALWQARYVAATLMGEAKLLVLKTKGDRIQHLTLDKVEGKGFFTKEIEAALLEDRADIAVHSFKDLPTEKRDDLVIGAVPNRAPVRDVLLIRREKHDASLKLGLAHGARVGTSSLRRKAHLLSVRADLELVDIRGNVPTRLARALDDLDAVVLAEAGLGRLELPAEPERSRLAIIPIDPELVCPAPAQGALAIQVRSGDQDALQAIFAMHDEKTARAVEAERLLLGRFGGGCHLPLGALATNDGTLLLSALVAAPDGSRRCEARAEGTSPEEVAEAVHTKLMAQGADEYL